MKALWPLITSVAAAAATASMPRVQLFDAVKGQPQQRLVFFNLFRPGVAEIPEQREVKIFVLMAR